MFKPLYEIAGDQEKPLRSLFFIMSLRGFVSLAPLIVIYFIIMELLSPSGSLMALIALTVLLAVYYIAFNAWDHILFLKSMRLGLAISYGVRMRLGDRLTRLSLGFFTGKASGELNTAMCDYVSRVEQFVTFQAPFLYSSQVTAVAMMALFIVLDWRLALAVASILPLSYVVFTYADGILKKVTGKREESLRKVSSVIVEFVQGMPAIKVFNHESSGIEKFAEAVKEFRDRNIRAATATTLPTVLLLLLSSLAVAIVFPVGLYLYYGGSLPAGTLVFFAVATPTFSDALSRYLYYYMHTKHNTSKAIAYISRLLAEKGLPEPSNGAVPSSYDIKFSDVYFKYDSRPVLEGVSFDIEEKSVAALVGPSGAGKTTISSLIARFWDAGAGSVRVGGIDVKDMRQDALLSCISFVFQDIVLFDTTVMENIRLGRAGATDEDVMDAARAAMCHEFIERLPQGYDTAIGERGMKLSGGEKQRISIARAILKDAPILILDEATVFVDPNNERLIQEGINRLAAGKTVLVIAHRLSTVRHADQIIVVESGKIVERGRHEELMARKGLYGRYWEEQNAARAWSL